MYSTENLKYITAYQILVRIEWVQAGHLAKLNTVNIILFIFIFIQLPVLSLYVCDFIAR